MGESCQRGLMVHGEDETAVQDDTAVQRVGPIHAGCPQPIACLAVPSEHGLRMCSYSQSFGVPESDLSINISVHSPKVRHMKFHGTRGCVGST
jgi:hypothetical protein